jgi:hypothetical protein
MRWCVLAVWMCYGARTTLEKIFVIIPPVAAFVAASFEHSIANIYYLSFALFIKNGAPGGFWSSIHKTPTDFSGADLGELPRRQPAAGDHRQYYRRLDYGRRRFTGSSICAENGLMFGVPRFASTIV